MLQISPGVGRLSKPFKFTVSKRFKLKSPVQVSFAGLVTPESFSRKMNLPVETNLKSSGFFVVAFLVSAMSSVN